MPLTQDLGQFVSDLSPNRVPEEAARIARTGFIDCIGVMFAGREEEPTRLLRDVLQPAAGPATLYFSDQKAGAPEAAWINGVAAHALDYDDVALRGHPSTVLVPAILAEAETLDVSGRDMVVAYIAGYETWAELGRRESGYHHGKGWHPTGIFGAIGAAAACAYLRRLDPARTAQALALGASQSAGLMANFWHDDQAVPRRALRPCRGDGGAVGWSGLYRIDGCAGASAGFSRRRVPSGERGS
jgi:2-methylcitrate dehydratase PrpD